MGYNLPRYMICLPSACAEGGMLCSSTVSIQVVHPVVSGKNEHRTIDGWFRMGKSMENHGNSWKKHGKPREFMEITWKTTGKYGKINEKPGENMGHSWTFRKNMEVLF